MATNKELEAKVDKLTGIVEALVNNLPKKEEVKAPEPADDEAKWELQELGGPSDPIPSEYRGLIDVQLNKNFGIHVKSGMGNFQFTILVPKKYSTMSDEQWKMLHFDKRVKVVPISEGLEGVRLFVEKVFNSFNPEYQAMIVADRIANV